MAALLAARPASKQLFPSGQDFRVTRCDHRLAAVARGGRTSHSADSENLFPKGAHGFDAPTDRNASDACATVGVESQDMLHAAEFTVRATYRVRQGLRDQTDFGGDAEQGDVAEVAAEASMGVCVPEHEVLDDELDVDQAAAIVLDVEQFFAARGVLVKHALSHR